MTGRPRSRVTRRPPPFMPSLRAKLTLYYLAILAAVLVFFGVAIYFYLAHGLLMIIDQSLGYQALVMERSQSGEAYGDGHLAAPAGGDQAGGMLIGTATVVQLIDAQGRVTDSEETAGGQSRNLPVDLAALGRLEEGRPFFETVRLPSGESIRVATRRARDADGDTYFIRIGQSLKPLQKARQRLLLVLGIAIPAVLLLGSYGGLLLANQALRPVDRMTRAAEQIGAGDLTERVPLPAKMDELGRLAATFNHMIARLQAAFERQRQFTSDASHELRTPLAVMRGDIEIALRRRRTPEAYEQVLTSNLEEIVRLSRLVEDLLTLARADAGRTALRCEPTSLDDLCRGMVEYISPLAQLREQELRYEPPPQDVVINGDVQRLKQLLLNLLDNAIKYTDLRGRVTLAVRAEGRSAVLTVADTGRGIPPEDLPHIFDRFFRRSRPTSDKSATGFGLGLSIVKWIVDSHGGKIEAASRPGEGTTFTVRFPLLEVAPPAEEAGRAERRKSGSVRVSESGTRPLAAQSPTDHPPR